MTIFTTSIEITAPREKIFKVLCDLKNYNDWHPGMEKIIGELGLNNWIDLYLGRKEKGRVVKIPVIVSVLAENEKLEWQGSLFRKGSLRKYFLVRHAFYVEDMGKGVTRFTNEEEFSSLLSWPVRQMKQTFIQGYTEVNEALKLRCENTEL